MPGEAHTVVRSWTTERADAPSARCVGAPGEVSAGRKSRAFSGRNRRHSPRKRRRRLSPNQGGSRPVSRVLSRATIPLRTRVTTGLVRPTRKRARIDAASTACAVSAASLFGLAPSGVCRAVVCYHRRGALLPHRFTLAGVASAKTRRLGGLLSVALSVGSRPPGVTWHFIRRSPDFPPLPPASPEGAAIARPTPAATIAR